MRMVEIARLREVLRYEPSTGKLFWRHRLNGPVRWNNRWAGKEAFTATDKKGYRIGTLDKKGLKAHRVIFAMKKGYWPIGVDHRNGVRSDNRWRNLREATRITNARNQKLPAHNTSGIIGIHKRRDSGKWMARIGDGEGRRYLGTFDTKRQAVAARRAAERELKYHRNHGRKSA